MNSNLSNFSLIARRAVLTLAALFLMQISLRAQQGTAGSYSLQLTTAQLAALGELPQFLVSLEIMDNATGRTTARSNMVLKAQKIPLN